MSDEVNSVNPVDTEKLAHVLLDRIKVLELERALLQVKVYDLEYELQQLAKPQEDII